MTLQARTPLTSVVLLPKIRSRALLDACAAMPCTLRVASFLPGCTCSGADTVVGCHIPTFGKGNATKVSDLFVAAGCRACHDLIDRRDPRVRWIEDRYPTAYADRLRLGMCETQARWVQMGLLTVKDGEIV